MTNKLLLLDLYSGSGIGATGYAEAGFHVEGVDIKPEKNYPYTHHVGDALAWLQSSEPEQFDVLHASPPCQYFTRAKHLRTAQGGKSSSLDLLTPTLELLRKKWSHKIWVVENVPGVRRHRLFVSNVSLEGSGCDHAAQGRPWGVYHVMGDSIPKGGRTAKTLEHGKEVMGVTQECTWNELKEGLPPTFTHHIGQQLLHAVAPAS